MNEREALEREAKKNASEREDYSMFAGSNAFTNTFQAKRFKADDKMVFGEWNVKDKKASRLICIAETAIYALMVANALNERWKRFEEEAKKEGFEIL